MSSNYIVQLDGVFLVSGSVSSSEFFVTEEDLNLLIIDSEVRKDFLESIGKNKVVLTHLGKNIDESTYERKYKSFLEVGVNRWK